MCCVNFRCRGVLPIWIIVGQGPVALAVGAGGGCLDILSLVYLFFILSQRAVKPKTTNKHQAGGETMTDVSREIYL